MLFIPRFTYSYPISHVTHSTILLIDQLVRMIINTLTFQGTRQGPRFVLPGAVPTGRGRSELSRIGARGELLRDAADLRRGQAEAPQLHCAVGIRADQRQVRGNLR